MTDDPFKKNITDQLKDGLVALVILAKEAVFALAVYGAGKGLAWAFGPGDDSFAAVLRHVCDGGALILFLVLVAKDIREYFDKE